MSTDAPATPKNKDTMLGKPMDTRSFLERVVANEGNYVLTVAKILNDKKVFWQWDNYTSLDAFVSNIQYVDKQPGLTAYFAVGTHINNVEEKPGGKIKVTRKKETAHKFRALCFDIDVGANKPYATAKDAARELFRAVGEVGLPEPMLVSSGYGIHAYWPLTADISASMWEKMSLALAGAMQKHKLELDWSKVHDTSMVLRPVGSHNKKDEGAWKDVRLLKDCPDYDPVVIGTALKPYVGIMQATKKPAAAPKRSSAMLDAVLSGTEFPPVNLDQVADGCAQVRALLKSGGVTDAMGNPVQEPLWRTSLGLVKFTENRNVSVTRIAGQHHDFDLQASLDKMYQWQGTGPATCAAFENVCAGGCHGCPSKGKITSPAALTRGEASITISTGEDEEDEELILPKSYLAKGGKIYREFTNFKKDKDASGKNVELEFLDTELVCPYLIWVVARYTDAERGTAMCLVRVKYPIDGVQEFEIPLSVLSAGGVELNKLFGNKQLFIKNDELLRKTRSYLMTYLQEIQAQVDTSYVYTSMGWQKDGSFLCGSELIGSNVIDFKTAGLAKSLKDHIRPVGTREAWKQAFSIFGHDKARLQGFFAFIGAGGLVMEGSTIDSALCNMFSPESGAGKSITQAAICSMWGYYPKLFLYPVDTDNSLYKSFGAMNSLTPCIDEITTIETDRLTEMLYNIPQGREKKRMTSDAELRASATWKAPIVSSSNKDLYALVDNVLGAQAQKMRLFQGYFQVDTLFTQNGEKLIATLQDNYGHAAPELARAIIAKGGPRVVYLSMLERFEAIFGFQFTGPERFIKAVFICAAAAGELMQEIGLIDFDYKLNIDRGIQELMMIRDGAIASTMDAFDVLGQFLLEHNAYLVEYKENKSVPTSRGVIKQPIPDYVVGRVEVALDSTNPVLPGSRLYINKVIMKRWLAKNGIDYTKVVMELAASKALLAESDRYSLHKGCDKSNPGQAYCWAMDLHHTRLRAVLQDQKGQVIQTTPRMAVVSGAIS